jgi:hypothetical protein
MFTIHIINEKESCTYFSEGFNLFTYFSNNERKLAFSSLDYIKTVIPVKYEAEHIKLPPITSRLEFGSKAKKRVAVYLKGKAIADFYDKKMVCELFGCTMNQLNYALKNNKLLQKKYMVKYEH